MKPLLLTLLLTMQCVGWGEYIQVTNKGLTTVEPGEIGLSGTSIIQDGVWDTVTQEWINEQTKQKGCSGMSIISCILQGLGIIFIFLLIGYGIEVFKEKTKAFKERVYDSINGVNNKIDRLMKFLKLEEIEHSRYTEIVKVDDDKK